MSSEASNAAPLGQRRQTTGSPRWRARGAVALLSLAVTLGAGRLSAQSDEDKAAARAMFMQGSEALAASRYAEALDMVSRAEQIFHAPPHMLLMGRAQAGLGKYVAAKETFLRLIREDLPPNAPAAFKRAQVDAQAELPKIEAKIGSLRIVLEGVGKRQVTLKLDDQTVPGVLIGVHRPVDPGRHEVIALIGGQVAGRATVELKPGERRELSVTLAETLPTVPTAVPLPTATVPPLPTATVPPPLPTVVPTVTPTAAPTAAPTTAPTAAPTATPWAVNVPTGAQRVDLTPPPPGFWSVTRGVGLGLGLAGLGVVGLGAFFMVDAGNKQSQSDRLFDTWGSTALADRPALQGRITELDQSAATARTGGVVSLIVGSSAAIAGFVMLGVGKPSPKQPPKAAVIPWFSGSMLGVRGEF